MKFAVSISFLKYKLLLSLFRVNQCFLIRKPGVESSFPSIVTGVCIVRAQKHRRVGGLRAARGRWVRAKGEQAPGPLARPRGPPRGRSEPAALRAPLGQRRSAALHRRRESAAVPGAYSAAPHLGNQASSPKTRARLREEQERFCGSCSSRHAMRTTPRVGGRSPSHGFVFLRDGVITASPRRFSRAAGRFL